MFTGVITNDSNFLTDCRAVRYQRQFRRFNVLEFGRVVAIEAEIVHRVPVDGCQLHLFVILENRLSNDRARRYDVTIRQYDAAFRIDNESGCLRRRVPLGIKRPRRIDTN